MDGTAWVGIGVLVGPPLAVVLSKVMPARASNGCIKPGDGKTCLSHTEEIGKLKTDTAVLRESLKRSEVSIHNSLERTDKSICDGLERIEKRLEHLRDS